MMRLGPFHLIGPAEAKRMERMRRLIDIYGEQKIEALLKGNVHIHANPKKKQTDKGDRIDGRADNH